MWAAMSDRLKRYEERTVGLMVGAGFTFLIVYGVPIIWPNLPLPVMIIIETVAYVIWLIFAVDLAIRAHLSGHWVRFLLRHPVDVVVVAVPMFRSLRVLRIFTAAHALMTRSGGLSKFKTTQAATAAVALLVVIGALAVLDAERSAPDSQITNFGDALWWSLVTVTTVGYGDLIPVTSIGRIVTAGLMITGVGLIGAFTASMAAWFMERTKDSPHVRSRQATSVRSDAVDKVSDLERKVDEIRMLLDGLAQRLNSADPFERPLESGQQAQAKSDAGRQRSRQDPQTARATHLRTATELGTTHRGDGETGA